MKTKESRRIVFFDGYCNFCNGTVDWVWKKNISGNLFFSSLQSEFAKDFLGNLDVNSLDLNTIYFYEDGKLYQKSTAAIRIMSHFNSNYNKLAHFLLWIPEFLRDSVYMLIAKSRYLIAGRRNTCRLATEEEKSRFIS